MVGLGKFADFRKLSNFVSLEVASFNTFSSILNTGKPYKHQSMFWSDLGPNIGYEALGNINFSSIHA